MSKTTRRPSIHIYALSVMALVLLSLVVIAIVPQWRLSFREALVSPEREILAAVNADLMGVGRTIRVIKVREGRNLYLEIYDEQPSGAPRRLDRRPLAGSKNAYFTFRGESTSLALSDIDGDGSLEIITPAFEGGMTARMNVFKYQPNHQKLIELKEVPLPGVGEHTN